mmetsp:Transcript_58934/g.110434  ORF Transcript_58934/g.110434 Transcript_58934/m.110434 type:complete len:207 (-) Transcript_58934:136-756(-)
MASMRFSTSQHLPTSVFTRPSSMRWKAWWQETAMPWGSFSVPSYFDSTSANRASKSAGARVPMLPRRKCSESLGFVTFGTKVRTAASNSLSAACRPRPSNIPASTSSYSVSGTLRARSWLLIWSLNAASFTPERKSGLTARIIVADGPHGLSAFCEPSDGPAPSSASFVLRGLVGRRTARLLNSKKCKPAANTKTAISSLASMRIS